MLGECSEEVNCYLGKLSFKLGDDKFVVSYLLTI